MSDSEQTPPDAAGRNDQPAEAPTPTDGAVQTAPLNRVWFIKIGIMTLALLGFGAWGLYDALVVYPERGERYAEHSEWKYLVALDEARTEEARFLERRAVVEDPVAELARLESDDERIRNMNDSLDPSSRRNKRATAQVARAAWLKGLKTIGKLDPEYTDFVESSDPTREIAGYSSPRERFEQLDAKWSQIASQPKPLAFYDIPSQWLIFGICTPFGLWLLFLFVRVISTKYRWDPAARKIGLPGGAWIGAGDLDEVDKSKWDKFIVFLKIKQGHESVGGQSLKLDLYRHAKLEGWVLELEEEAFGPQDKDEADESSAEEPAPSSAG